ncbi:DUF58 domain-containing protein [Microbacterium sp. SLBN-146]|uniref:DUF58 domain-containing protein n=1 Tax=Microbacterium sp. SLBN-146 TaxID=2768457 RepID=UPI0011524A8D|nr:DUF58 domain-containing protein [Microbacterium sp. SLBN-146]TQJ31341.1 uncharacterized protein (DUF58 family) [Microbacterium sp. SLBN-146]
MRRAWPLTVRGTGALALAITCFVLAHEFGIVELQYFGILLSAVIVAGVVSLFVMRRSAAVVRWLHPDVASVGRQTLVDVRVGMRTAVPTPAGTWHDALPAGLAGRAEGPFPALGSGLLGGAHGGARTIGFSYSVTGMRRGIHSIGPLSVRATDPFGIARRTIVFGDRTAVTVAPAIVDLPPLADFAGETGGTLQTTTNQLGQGADNLVARPYAPGDSMRRIHWRATAHRDELMVRQEEQESTPEATVVLDRGVLRWSSEAMTSTGSDPGFEMAVSACVSAVARLVHDGYAVEVIDSDGTVIADRIDGGDMPEIEHLATHLATLTARRDDSLARLKRLFAGAATGPLVVIVGRFDPADAEAIAPVAPHSTLPILLAIGPRGDALDRAADAGWRACALDPEGDLAATWGAAVGRGVSRVI